MIGAVDTAESAALSKLLRDCGVRCVAIVDDIFDQLDEAQLALDEITDFWGYLEFDHQAREEMSRLGGVTIESANDITAPMIAKLFARRGELTHGAWNRTMIGQRLAAAMAQLDPLIEHLRYELQLDVQTLGRDDASLISEHGDTQIVFLDWQLGHDGTEDAVSAAVATASAINNSYRSSAHRPFFVLMSSNPDVRVRAEEFRERSQLLGGTFMAVPKNELTDTFALHLHLRMLAFGYPVGYQLQRFHTELRDRIEKAGSDFLNVIDGLTLSDYAYVERLSTSPDGQPFGEYVRWLIGAYFNHLLFASAMSDPGRALDAMEFANFIPSEIVPSMHLAQLYWHALFDPSPGPLAPHPKQLTGTNSQSPELMLSLGDVLERQLEAEPGSTSAQIPLLTDELYLVINAQCDLAVKPDGSRARKHNPSVILVPGSSFPLSVALRSSQEPRTELFFKGDDPVRIVWDVKKARAIPYVQFIEWIGPPGARRYERVARLRPTFALEIQRAFAASLTRVGAPTAPPIYQPLSVLILRCNSQGVLETLHEETGPGGAFLMFIKDERQCVLTTALLIRVYRALEKELRESAPQRLAAVKGKLPDLEALCRPRRLPPEKGEPLFGKDVTLVVNKLAGDSWPKSATLLVSLQLSGHA
jgi:hypothetical protein